VFERLGDRTPMSAYVNIWEYSKSGEEPPHLGVPQIVCVTFEDSGDVVAVDIGGGYLQRRFHLAHLNFSFFQIFISNLSVFL